MTTNHSIIATFVWLMICSSPKTNAFDDIMEISIKTGADWSWSPGTAVITLWFNLTIYQFSVQPTANNKWYSYYKQQQPSFYIVGTQCSDSTNATEAKLMIELNNEDAVGIDQVKFITKSNVWYGVNQFYIENVLKTVLCIGNTRDDCLWSGSKSDATYKRIIFFDLMRPNEDISDAIVTDGSNVFPQQQICHTISATSAPSYTSTDIPPVSIFPSYTPTNIPSHEPTNIPSYTPTNAPSNTLTNTPSSNTSSTQMGATVTSTWTLFAEQATNTTYTNTFGAPPTQNFLETHIELLLIVFFCILFIIAAVLVYMIRYYQRKGERLEQNERNLSELTKPVPNVLTVTTSEERQGTRTKAVCVTQTTPGTGEGTTVINARLVMQGSAKLTKGE